MFARSVTAALHCPRCDVRLDGKPSADADVCPACGIELVAVDCATGLSRIAAASLDLLCLGLTALPLHLGLRALVRDDPTPPRGLDAFLQFGAQDLSTIVFQSLPLLLMAGLYYSLFIGLTGRTPGLSLLRLRVVTRDGSIPHPVIAAWRYVAAVFGSLPATLGFWWLLVDPDRRAFHDHASRTYVVRHG